MEFREVAQAFRAIEQESSRVKMTQLLAELFSKATPVEAEIIANLSLGSMRAAYLGTKFNFAEKGMKEVVARVLGVTVETVTRHLVKTGDLGAVIAGEEWQSSESPSIHEVFHTLVKFEEISGEGSIEEKITFFTNFLKKVDPLSACYLVRIVIQKLRLGFSEMTVIDAISWFLVGDKSLRDTVEYAFNVSADVGHIARLAREGGAKAIENVSIVVGIPIRPAAAERLPNAADIIKKVGACVAQPKFDGFRLQVHVKKTEHRTQIHFFSRNLLDMSHMFPDLKQAVHDLDVSSLVMEGEALAYDEQTGSYLPFQETVKRRRKHDIEEMATELPLKLVLFDLLYLDGDSLLDIPEFQRQKKLEMLIKGHTSDLLTVTEQIKIETAEELERYFNKNITAGLEGVMIKRPDAVYKPGKRNFNWIKLKRSHHGKLEDTIDAVVLGYYHGEGKRASFGIGALLIGIYNKHEDRFETIAKVGTGLTDENWIKIKKKCDSVSIRTIPHNVVIPKELVPDIITSPEIVIVIFADEITRSPVHTAGLTDKELGFALRFPRFIDYREDKSPTEVTEIREIKRLFADQREVAEAE